jgi:tRNA modification GTPase
VCICGRPNVGKSSLLNALLGEQRVIVTPVPGTTRDVIEESINLNGLPVALWDTAGIRVAEDDVEKLGVELSMRYVDKADAAVVVLDGSAAMTDDDRQCLRWTAGKKRLIVINKNDLPQVLDLGGGDRRIANAEVIYVSAMSGKGLKHLRDSLRDLLLDMAIAPPVVLTNLRHRAALVAGDQALSEAVNSVENGDAAEFVAVSLQAARERLEEITGKITNDDILERVFSQFCIGK